MGGDARRNLAREYTIYTFKRTETSIARENGCSLMMGLQGRRAHGREACVHKWELLAYTHGFRSAGFDGYVLPNPVDTTSHRAHVSVGHV